MFSSPSLVLGDGLCSWPPYRLDRLEMIHPLARQRIYKTMRIDAATARERVGENFQTFKTEACVAIATCHLVTLLVLGSLPFQVLLGDCYLAGRALLSAGFLHPLLKAVLGLSVSDVSLLSTSGAHTLRMFLTSESFVVRLAPATKA